jgi:hypothetical protein
VLKEVPASAVVLAAASERFRAQAERWGQLPAAGDSSAALQCNYEQLRGSAERSSASGKPVLEVSVASEADATALEHCLRFAYTGKLPAQGQRRFASLMSILQQAQYMLQPACCEAALAALAALPFSALSVEEAAAAAALDPTLPGTPSAAKAQQLGMDALLHRLGDTVAVMNSAELQQQWARLPLAAALALLSSHRLATDSEDSVVALASVWADANEPDAAAAQRLAGVLRLCQLSGAYFATVLPALAWLEGALPLRLYGRVAGLRAAGPADTKGADFYKGEDMPDAWFSRTKRPASPSAGAPAVLLDSRLITRQAVARYLLPRLAALPEGQTTVSVQSELCLFAYGYDACLCVELDKATNALGVFLHADLPMACDKALKPLWRLDFSLGLQLPADAAADAYSHAEDMGPAGAALAEGWGWSAFYAFPAGHSIMRLEDWDALLLVGGALKLRAMISGCP